MLLVTKNTSNVSNDSSRALLPIVLSANTHVGSSATRPTATTEAARRWVSLHATMSSKGKRKECSSTLATR